MKRRNLARRFKKGLASAFFGRTGIILLLLMIQIGLLFGLFHNLQQYFAHFFSGIVLFTAGMLIYVLNRPGTPAAKLSWCVLIAVVPVFGALLYGFVRLDIGHRLEQRAMRTVMVQSAKFIPKQSTLMRQLEDEDKALYNLATYTFSHGGYPVYKNTAVTYFPSGESAFRQMRYELEHAKQFIFLEYFIIDRGYMWDSILEILKRKAREGVEVRVFYDGTCSVSRLPYNYPKQLARMGIDCKVFSPLHPLVSTYQNHRDHRKILIIDGHTAFTGGINLADEYINRRELYGHWKDNAVLLRGEAVQSFTLMFLQLWNMTEREPQYAAYLRQSQLPTYARGYVIPFGDSPMDKERVGEMIYLDIISRAKNYVYIMTPYLILDQEMITALTFAAKRGVEVKLILPHKPDKKYAFVLARSHYRELTEAGVQIFEYLPGFVHAKTFVSDDRYAVVGTINLDYRSLYLHFECAAYLHDVPAIADILHDFRRTERKSRRVTVAQIRNQPARSRIAAALLKIIAPLL